MLTPRAEYADPLRGSLRVRMGAGDRKERAQKGVDACAVQILRRNRGPRIGHDACKNVDDLASQVGHSFITRRI